MFIFDFAICWAVSERRVLRNVSQITVNGTGVYGSINLFVCYESWIPNDVFLSDTHESFKNILSKLFDEDTEEKVHLMYLNTLVKLLLHYEKNAIEINFNRKDILCW